MWKAVRPSSVAAAVMPEGHSFTRPPPGSGDLKRKLRTRMRPDVALWTVIYHGTAVAKWASVLAAALALEAALGDQLAEVLPQAGAVVFAHVAATVCIVGAWAADRACRLPWDVVSVASAAVMCAAQPWIGQWVQHHGGQVRCPVFFAAALAMGYATYVPVSRSQWLVVPVSSIASFALFAGTCGAPAPRELPRLLGTLFLPILALGGNLRRREVLERLTVLSDMLEMEPRRDQVQADLTFFLSEDCRMLRTASAVHDGVFGLSAENLRFESLLPPAQRFRFAEVLGDVEASGAARCLEACSLRLPRGELTASLRVAPVDASQRGEDGAFFHMGLFIEPGAKPRQRRQCRRRAPRRASTPPSSWTGSPSVAPHARSRLLRGSTRRAVARP